MTKEELGGSHIHRLNGVTDNVADSEEEATVSKALVPIRPPLVVKSPEQVSVALTGFNFPPVGIVKSIISV